MAFTRTIAGIRDGWFCFDMCCVCSLVVDVLCMPPLYELGMVGETPTGTQLLRALRFGRLLRLSRALRGLRDLRIVVKGTLVGMQSAVYVWMLLAFLVFTFGLGIFGSIQDGDVKRDFFSTPQHSMRTLMVTGIMLDGVSKLGKALAVNYDFITVLLFSVFQLIAFFGLLNMLIAVFCNSAMQIATTERNELDLRYLENHLMDILVCYLEDDESLIDKTTFELMMKNSEVNNTLKHCGTDVDTLLGLSGSLFPTAKSTISIEELFEMIMRLRSGTPACASHIVSLSSTMEQRFDNLDRHVMPKSIREIGKHTRLIAP